MEIRGDGDLPRRNTGDSSALPRYDLVQVNACYQTDHEMERSDDGEWVRYDDLVRVLSEVVETAASEGWLCYRGTDVSRLEALEDIIGDAEPQ